MFFKSVYGKSLFLFSRYMLLSGIQQENRHIRQLQHENKELRAALEEHQNAIELIMSKYRQHITCLVHSSKLDNNAIKHQKSRVGIIALIEIVSYRSQIGNIILAPSIAHIFYFSYYKIVRIKYVKWHLS